MNTSYEMWQALETNFSSHSKARIMQYNTQLQILKKNNLSIREYVNRVKSCCDALAASGNKINEQEQIDHILTGLGSEYDAVVVSVTSRPESFTLNDVTALLLSYESRLETASQVNAEGTLLSANVAVQGQNKKGNQSSSQSTRGRGYQQNYRGGINGGRGFRGRGGRFGGYKPVCQVCLWSGHTADKCYHRYDANFVPTYQNQGQKNNLDGSANCTQFVQPVNQNGAAFYGAMDQNSEFNWYLDSGASNHITNEFSNLNMASKYHGPNKVQIENGTGSSYGVNSS